MSEDDDLPVLTHVLRTGSGGATRRAAPQVIEPLFDDFDVRPLDELLMTDPLVIGNDQHDGIEPYLSMPVHEGPLDPRMPVKPIADGRHADDDGGDAFRLSHDHDHQTGPSPAFIDAFEEPEVGRAHAPVGSPRAIDADALAARVRDAVLDSLGARIDTEFDARIAQALHLEVETALAQLQVNLRLQLTEALRDVVGRAVEEEIARTMASPQGPLPY